MSSESDRLSVEDESVRAIRNRVNAAKLRIEIAMRFTMHREVREQLRCVQSDLAVALAYISGK
jgi:hypothetical protein